LPGGLPGIFDIVSAIHRLMISYPHDAHLNYTYAILPGCRYPLVSAKSKRTQNEDFDRRQKAYRC